MSNSVIDEMVGYTQRVRDGLEKVRPGMPLAFTEASTSGDAIWQGDLAIVISDRTESPEGFVSATIKSNIFQLVPGQNTGSRHCVDVGSVDISVPSDWNDESTVGPFLKVKSETTITHPVHGNVTIPAGFCVEMFYQREWDREQERERRARD